MTLDIPQNSPLIDMPRVTNSGARVVSGASWMGFTGANNAALANVSSGSSWSTIDQVYWRDALNLFMSGFDTVPEILTWVLTINDLTGALDIQANGGGLSALAGGRSSRCSFVGGVPIRSYRDTGPGISIAADGFGGSANLIVPAKWAGVQIVSGSVGVSAVAGMNDRYAFGFYPSTTNIAARAVTFNGTAAANVAASANVITGLTTPAAIDATQTVNGKIFLAWIDSGTGKISANVLSTGASGGGSSITPGTTVDLATNAIVGANADIALKVLPISATQVAVLYTSTSEILKLVICDISGTTISAGTAIQVSPDAMQVSSGCNTPFAMDVVDVTNNILMIAYLKNTDQKPYCQPIRILDRNTTLRTTEVKLSNNTYNAIGLAKNPWRNSAGVVLAGTSKLDIIQLKP